MAGNYDGIIRDVLNSTAPTVAGPLPQPVIAQPPTGVSDADAYTDSKNKILSFMADQQAKSAEMGLWDPATNMPTPLGMGQAGMKYGAALAREQEGAGLNKLPEFKK